MSTVIGTQQSTVAEIGTLDLEHGGAIDDVRLAFSMYGDSAAPPVLVLGGISAGRHLLDEPGSSTIGWWPGVVGPSLALDPQRYCLIGVDYIGGRGESSRPGPGDSWPALSTRDQATAINALLETLAIERLHAVVGASYGGMVALALAEQYSARVQRLVAICAAHRSNPMAAALRSIQRRIVRLAASSGTPQQGVAVARALAMTTYRTSDEFEERFRGDGRVVSGVAHFPVDAYLDHHGCEYAASFPAEAFLTLSQSLDLHRIDPRRITTDCHCTLVAFDSDTLVPVRDVRALAMALPQKPDVRCIATRFGHDGFLKETHAVSGAIAAALHRETRSNRSAAPAGRPADGQPGTHYAARASRATRAPATGAARAGIGSDRQYGAVIPPIQLSTTFTFEDVGAKRAYDYTRSGNPTRDLLAGAIAELERGAAGLVTPTGMAAIAVTLQLLRPGDLLLAAHDGYGGTYRLLQALARRHAFEVEFVDLTSPAAAPLIQARRPRMVWVETPSNPLLRISDIAVLAAAARTVGALCVADNTFLSPALQTPIELGADIVVHSTTKYLNGHSDVVGGAIVARDVAIAEELGWWANCTGATGSPFDSYLTLRGLRTLHPRMRAHEENAAAIADVLHSHGVVRAVHYPGLPTHPGHETAVRQQRGFGGMLSFELHGGEPAIRSFIASLEHFSLAESLGGVESLIAHPATMTHAAMDAAARRNAGISDALLRISVGIEDVRDLRSDVSRALERAAR